MNKLINFLYIFKNEAYSNSKEIIWPLLQVAWFETILNFNNLSKIKKN